MVITRLGFYAAYLWEEIGPAAIVFAVIGIAIGIWRGRRWQEDAPLPMAQAMMGSWSAIVHLSHAQPAPPGDGRYITLDDCAGVRVGGGGILTVAGRFIAGRRRHSIQAALLGVLVVTTFFARPALAVRKPFGYHEMVNACRPRGDPGQA